MFRFLNKLYYLTCTKKWLILTLFNIYDNKYASYVIQKTNILFLQCENVS